MRHEKKLLAVPVQPCPDLPQKDREKISPYGYAYYILYAAEIIPVDEEEALAVTTFGVDGKPCRRFWQIGDQAGVEVFRKENGYGANNREPGRMYGASIDYFYNGVCGSLYGGNVTRFYGEPDSANAVLRYLGKPDGTPEKAVALLAKHQQENREAAIHRRDEKKRERIRESFLGVQPGAPDWFKAWCEDVPMADFRYFFYTYTGKKKQDGICSYCGKQSRVAGIRNRQLGTCPACGSRVRFWSLRQLNMSHGIKHRIEAAFCQMVNGRIVARRFFVGIILTGAGMDVKKQIWASEVERIFLDGEKAIEVERYVTPTGTTKVYVDSLCKAEPFGSSGPCAVAPMNIEAIRKSLGLYTPLEELAASGCTMDPVMVWRRAKKKPEAEYLIKLGLYRLAENELSCYESDVLCKGKNVAELLGVPKETVNQLRFVNPTARAMKVIRGLIKCGTALSLQDMQDINELGIVWGSIKIFQAMVRYTSVHKSLRYIRKQMESCKSFSNAGHVLQTWGDYIVMAMQAGKDIDDIHVAIPKNLKTAHDETAKILRMQKDKNLNEAVGKSAGRLMDLCWAWSGLTIRPAGSQEELFQEGEALNHCVGRMGYAENMANFNTAIFFIRREKKPDVPYVTLELDLKKWKKIQCYGKGDKWPGKQVDSFVTKWITDIVKPARCEKAEKTA